MERQQQLFDGQDPAAIKRLEERRRSRPTDPTSSLLGEQHIEGRLGALQMCVLAVASYVPQTARELAELAAERFGGEVESYRKRARELCRKGELREGAFRKCQHTNRLAVTFTRSY